jgi:hypothetical protein
MRASAPTPVTARKKSTLRRPPPKPVSAVPTPNMSEPKKIVRFLLPERSESAPKTGAETA